MKAESDLYQPVKEWLKEKGFYARAEVMGCDVLAVKEEIALAVELKMVLNLEVILQAVDRQRFSDIVYIAVPKKGRLLFSKRWKQLIHLLKRLELGLLVVSFRDESARVEEVLEPKPFDRVRSRNLSKKKRNSVLAEYNKRHGDHNKGGVNKTKLVTAYREDSIKIAYLMSVEGIMSPSALRKRGTSSKTLSILSKNFYGWFEHLDRGRYGLSEKGKNALLEYSLLVSQITHEIIPEK